MTIAHSTLSNTGHLQRFILQRELRQLSQFLVFMTLNNIDTFPCSSKEGCLKDLMREFEIQDDVIDWLMSHHHPSIQSMAETISNHNRLLIIQLTRPREN